VDGRRRKITAGKASATPIPVPKETTPRRRSAYHSPAARAVGDVPVAATRVTCARTTSRRAATIACP